MTSYLIFSVTAKNDSSDYYEKLPNGSEQGKQKQNKPVSIGHQKTFFPLICQISIVIYRMSRTILDYKDIKANDIHYLPGDRIEQ